MAAADSSACLLSVMDDDDDDDDDDDLGRLGINFGFGDDGDGLTDWWPDVLFLKHYSRIIKQSSNPVFGSCKCQAGSLRAKQLRV